MASATCVVWEIISLQFQLHTEFEFQIYNKRRNTLRVYYYTAVGLILIFITHDAGIARAASVYASTIAACICKLLAMANYFFIDVSVDTCIYEKRAIHNIIICS